MVAVGTRGGSVASQRTPMLDVHDSASARKEVLVTHVDAERLNLLPERQGKANDHLLTLLQNNLYRLALYGQQKLAGVLTDARMVAGRLAAPQPVQLPLAQKPATGKELRHASHPAGVKRRETTTVVVLRGFMQLLVVGLVRQQHQQSATHCLVVDLQQGLQGLLGPGPAVANRLCCEALSFLLFGKLIFKVTHFPFSSGSGPP